MFWFLCVFCKHTFIELLFNIFDTLAPYNTYTEIWTNPFDAQGPVVQSVISLTSSLRVI